MVRLRKICFRILSVVVLLLIATAAANEHVKNSGQKYVVAAEDCPDLKAAVVMGAYVSPEGKLCDMLADRVHTAVALYHDKKVTKIIMTGDHGSRDYDEVNHMRLYAEKLGVLPQDIFMDHAGFSTYDSMYRAKKVFMVDSAVVVTQAFHLPRAVYTARALGIEAVGVAADRHVYVYAGYYDLREIPARVKAFAYINLLRPQSRYLGSIIPVDGDGRLTRD